MCRLIRLGGSRLEGELAELEALQQSVVRQLPDPRSFFPLSREELAALMSGKGLILGLYDQDRLIGCRAVYEPGYSPDNLGRELGLEQLDQVLHLEATVIHPDYRGSGLQVRLTRHIMEGIAEQPNIRYLLCTVDPGNAASLLNLFSLGLTVRKLVRIYGGLLRYIMMKDIRSALEEDGSRTLEPAVIVDIRDTERQMELLRAGYIGAGLARTGSNKAAAIRYIQPIASIQTGPDSIHLELNDDGDRKR